jgi:transposase
MDWVQDMTERWMRIMAATGEVGMPLDEAVRQIHAIADVPAKKRSLGRRRGKGSGADDDASAVTVLCRQLFAGVLVSDIAITRLGMLEGQTREQVLAQLADDVPGRLGDRQLHALQAELVDSHSALQDPERASYAGLGARIEQLLRLAEQQATELVEAARVEAARITASGGAPTSAPGVGSGHDGLADDHLGS